MKKLFTALSLLWMLASAATASAQAITTTPTVVKQTSTQITLTFHSDGGNRGLLGTGSGTDLYVHTGVITSGSTSATDWKHATTWGDNSAKYKLTPAGTDTWTLTIPSVREFYGITDPSEIVKQMVFVVRNQDGSREAKTATGGDIRVQVYGSDYPGSTQKAYPGGKPRMGATANADGSVTFCLAAPGKQDATFVSSANGYAVGASSAMNYQDYEGNRYFWATVPGMADGKDYTYYYIVDGCSFTGDPYAHLVLDQWDNQIPKTVYPDIPAYPSQHISSVPVAVYNSKADDYAWQANGFKGVAQNDLIIYELLLRDFTGTEGNSLGNGTVRGAIEKLDYLKELGVNAIELLPIMEFNGNNSWGYNTNFYMAPDKAYGTPSDYRELIDEAHKRGMAVILDIVFNQTDAGHPWYDMYTRKASPFYNGSAPHSYSVLNDWNQDSPLVQQQFKDALRYWLEAYRVDGFRFDLVKGLGSNDSYGTPYDASTNTFGTPSEGNTNRYNASRVARMKALHAAMKEVKPDAYFINEDLAGAQEENEMAQDGETNWANINHQSGQYAMGYLDDDASLNRFYAPLDERTWGSTVSYAESHDEERVAYMVKTYAPLSIRNNLASQMLRLGSLAAQMILSPGAHMIWQFEELGNDQTTKNQDGSNNTAPKRVNWNMLKSAPRKGLHDTYASLCAIRSEYAHMFAQDVKTDIKLSSQTARSIALAKGTAELYLIINPAISGSATIPAPVNPQTGAAVDLSAARFTLLASSYQTTPVATAAGVTLPAGTFAVYGANLESGIEEVISDNSTKPVITVDNGIVKVLTPYTMLSIHSLSGASMPTDASLVPGIYLVTVDGTTVKICVR